MKRVNPFKIGCCITACMIMSLVQVQPALNAEQDNDSMSSKKILIVPDYDTFIYYLSTWTDTERFPIFIGRNAYTEKFASAYNNGRVEYVYTDKHSLPALNDDLLYAVILASCADASLEDVRINSGRAAFIEYCKKTDYIPKGMVLTNTESPEFPAALSLAVYHKQIIELYSPPIRPIFGNYTLTTKNAIRADIINLLEKWPYPYKEFGKGIDAITIGLDMPFKYENGYALDDAINRLDDGKETPFAVTGRLMEVKEGAALYQAMCSMFLSTSRGLFFDLWPLKWRRALDTGYWELAQHIPCSLVKYSFAQWHKATMPINRYDLLFVNSSGYPDSWSGGRVEDIPDTMPVAVHFAHSASAANPYDPDTIAGRWLYNGAFVYYGSITEPYSPAFNLSHTIINKWVAGSSFAEAVQQKDEIPPQYAKPWKLFYIGDPLFFANFTIYDEDEQWFNVTKQTILSLKKLSFGKAETLLTNYLSAHFSLSSDIYKYSQQMHYLNKLYELTALENIYGLKLSQLYSEQFLRSWFAGYPVAKTLRPQTDSEHEAVLDYYMKKYPFIKNKINNYSYLDSLWYSVVNGLINKKTVYKQWIVIGPGDEPVFREKIRLRLNNSKAVSGQGDSKYTVHEVVADAITHAVFLPDYLSEVRNSWYASQELCLSDDAAFYVHFSASREAEFYIDGVQIGVVSGKSDIGNQMTQVTLKKGKHYLDILFTASTSQNNMFDVRYTDSDGLSVEALSVE
ncbi:MAG: hypothetical protein AB1454_10545 [Candidatus Auribacterota bacterium]